MRDLFEYMVGCTLSDQPGEMGTHVLPLFAIAIASPAEVLIETGVRCGGSTFPLLSAAYLTKRKLISIDIRFPRFNATGDFAKNWDFRLKDALEFLEDYDKKIEFIFIDDCHKYLHVKRELEIIATKVDKASIILMHDAMGEGSAPEYFVDSKVIGDFEGGGPGRVLLELDKDIWEYATFPWCHGLTLLRKIG